VIALICGTSSCRKDVSVPKKFPPEFKRDVVRVARRGDLSQAEVAADFDISVESPRSSYVSVVPIHASRRRAALGCAPDGTKSPSAPAVKLGSPDVLPKRTI